MRKLLILAAAVLVAMSFLSLGTAQNSDELRGGVTDPGVPDSPNESTDNETNETSGEEDEDNESGPSCGKSPSSEASSTAKKVLNVIFCTSQNIGNALSGLLGG